MNTDYDAITIIDQACCIQVTHLRLLLYQQTSIIRYTLRDVVLIHDCLRCVLAELSRIVFRWQSTSMTAFNKLPGVQCYLSVVQGCRNHRIIIMILVYNSTSVVIHVFCPHYVLALNSSAKTITP